MNTRSPYPDVEVPEVSLPRFVLDRADEQGAAVPLMGPADHGSVSPLMGSATAGTITPLMGPAASATITPLMGPATQRHPASEPVILTWIPGRCPSSSTMMPSTNHVDRGRQVPDHREFPARHFQSG